MTITLSLPLPYNICSFNVKLGNKSTSGVFVNAPNTNDYFKLYVSKCMELRPYATYRVRSGIDDWELWLSGAVPMVYSVSQWASKVNA